ncbi:MAG: FHA domain-containing protein [Lachnospiraceae bacterium]|nr:FHA domain-containing protein [Lachnospiraceae bacterium]
MKKISFRVRNFDKEQFLTFNIDNNAELDDDVLDFLEDEEPEGIVPVIFEEGDEFDTFSYDITDKIQLRQLSAQEINAEMVLKVIRGLVISMMNMSEYRIPLSYLVLNRRYIYIDSDYKVEFVCIPLEDMKEEVDLTHFIRNFIASLRFDPNENGDYVAKILTYVNNREMFNLHNLLELVEEWMDRLGIEIPERESNEIYGEYTEIVDESVEVKEDALDAVEAAESAEDEDALDAVEAAESTEDEDVLDAVEAAESTEDEDVLDAVEAAESAEDEDVLDAVEAAESAEDEDTLDAVETAEGAEDEDVLDAVETAEGAEGKDTLNAVEAAESAEGEAAMDAVEATESAENEDTSDVAGNTGEEPIWVSEKADSDETDTSEDYAKEADNDEVDASAITGQKADEAEEANAQENMPEEPQENKKIKKPHFRTRESNYSGVVIEDELDAFLAEKDREDHKASNIKINKGIKINRASILKNTMEEHEALEPETDHVEETVVEEDGNKPSKKDNGKNESVKGSVTKEATRRLGRLIRNKEAVAEDTVENTEPAKAGDAAVHEEAEVTTAPDKPAESEKPASAPIPKVNPYLIRVNTDERIMITKQTFKIGKAGMGVDYTISGNGAISRVHAIITGKDGEYFIKDNKSTNHTFVNGKSVDEGESEKLTDNCKIVLGDEEFIFKLQ